MTEITLDPTVIAQTQALAHTTQVEQPSVALMRQRRLCWPELLKRTFSVDILQCPNCSGRLRIIAAINEPQVVRDILSHLGLPTEQPPLAPARAPPEQLDFDEFGQDLGDDEALYLQ